MSEFGLLPGDAITMGIPGAEGFGASSAKVVEVSESEIVVDCDGRFASAKPGVVITVRKAAEYNRIGWSRLLETKVSGRSIYMRVELPRWESPGASRGERRQAEYRVVASFIENTPEGTRQRHFSGHTLDVSTSGARIWLNREFEPDELVQLRIYFCEDSPTVAIARTAHQSPDREGTKVGLEFLRVIEGSEHLERALAADPTPAKTEPVVEEEKKAA